MALEAKCPHNFVVGLQLGDGCRVNAYYRKIISTFFLGVVITFKMSFPIIN